MQLGCGPDPVAYLGRNWSELDCKWDGAQPQWCNWDVTGVNWDATGARPRPGGVTGV